MGPTAVLEVGNIKILITSFATYEWCGEQFETLRLEAASSKFVVAKNPMNYGMAYGEFAQATFILDTPGPTPATLKHVAYKHLQRPYFPADEEITDWQPTILRSELRQLSTRND
jgi:microcystin degradation protein MlrC